MGIIKLLVKVLCTILITCVLCLEFAHAGAVIHLTAGIPGDFPPQYEIDENNNLSGFAIDVMEAVASKIGISVTYKVFKSWKQAQDALANNRIDLIPNMGITARRKSFTYFSTPYETFPVVIFIRSSDSSITSTDDLRKKKIGAVHLNVGEKIIQNVQSKNVVIKDSRSDLLFALLSGQVDAIIYPQPLIERDATEIGLLDKVKILGGPLAEIKRGIGFSHDNRDLVTDFNYAISSFVDSSEYKKIYSKWYGVKQQSHEYLYVGLGCLVASFFFVLIFIAYRKYSRKVSDKINRERLKYQLLFNELSVGFALHEIVLDRHGVPIDYIFLNVNPAFESITGLNKNDICGKSVFEVLPMTEQYWVEQYGKVVLTGSPSQFESYSQELNKHFEVRAYSPKFGQFVTLIMDTTKAVLAYQNLRNSERKWRHILENIPQIGLAIDTSGKIVFANEYFLNLTGWSQEEILGANWFDTFIPDEISSDMKEVFSATIQLNHEQGYSAYDNEILAKDGTRLYISWANILTLNEEGGVEDVTCMGIDLTERKRAEAEIELAKIEFETIFNTSQIGILMLKKGRFFHRGNQRLADILGYDSPDDMTGIDMRQIHLSEESYIDFGNRFYGKLKDEDQIQVEYQLCKKDGSSVWCNLSGKALNTKDLNTGVVWVIDDLGPRKQLELELEKTAADAEKANRSKSEFLANMSHEIRTPINGVMGMIQLLQQTALTDEQDEYASYAIKSTKRLTRLLSDILDLARVEAGRLNIDYEKILIRDLFDEINQLFQAVAKNKGLNLVFDVDSELPKTLLTDPIRIHQIISNILGNAIKFSDRGTINFSASKIYQSDDRVQILFTISDQGIGMSDDRISNLFEPFEQESTGYQRTHQGAGLGLAITKKIVDLMGGNISISSSENSGTKVYVSMPFKVANDVQSIKNDENYDAKKGNLKLLLAEDDATSQLVAQKVLENMGHMVFCVDNGQKVLSELLKNTYDVVLMDIQMPKMDGVEATKRIRNGEAGDQNKSIKIIAMTAYSMRGDKEKFFDSGLDAYIAKPIDIEKIGNVLGNFNS